MYIEPPTPELPALCQSLADLVLSTVSHVAVASQLLFQGAVCQMCTRLPGARSCVSNGWDELGALLGGAAVPFAGLDQRRLA